MPHWSEKKCLHYAQGQGILTLDERQNYLRELDSEWEITTTSKKDILVRKFKFKQYKDVLAFVARVGNVAEKQDHHPDMLVKWGECDVYFHTHSAKGITLNDVICAYLIDKIA